MKNTFHAPNGKSVVAVSGGVDSMVLLDLMFDNGADFVVAHFIHGVRSEHETKRDIKVIEDYCKERNIPVVTEAYAGADTSEAALREVRYDFLERVKNEYNCNNVITAHHADDRIETAIINLLRGSQGAGLDSLKDGVINRPLLSWSKEEIRTYAEEWSLKWHEDSTNTDETYLRNYVRRTIVPKMQQNGTYETFVATLDEHKPLQRELDSAVTELYKSNIDERDDGVTMRRSWFIQLPHSVAKTVLHAVLSDARFEVELQARAIDKAVVFAKTAKAGATLHLSKTASMIVANDELQILSND